MTDKGTYVNFWSLIEAYDPKLYDVIIEKVKGEDKLRVAAYRKMEFGIFGFKVSKQKLKVEWIIDIDVDRDIFDHVVNPDFKDDISVNCSAFMKYAEQGFNENKIDILSVLEGVEITKRATDSLEEYNYRLMLLHCAVGMASEVGEFLDHINKYVNHNKPLDKAKIASELGDVEWYKFNALRLLGISFSDTLRAVKIKLDTRYPNGRDKNYLAQMKAKDTDKEDDLIQKKLYDSED